MLPEQFGMALHESVDIRGRRGLADEVGHVDGEEVAGSEEAVNGRQA